MLQYLCPIVWTHPKTASVNHLYTVEIHLVIILYRGQSFADNIMFMKRNYTTLNSIINIYTTYFHYTWVAAIKSYPKILTNIKNLFTTTQVLSSHLHILLWVTDHLFSLQTSKLIYCIAQACKSCTNILKKCHIIHWHMEHIYRYKIM